MNHAPTRESLLTPRWTWRFAALAALVTAATFLLLPCLEMVTAPPERTVPLRNVDSVHLPPPPAPEPPPPSTPDQPSDRAREFDRPKPRLQQSAERPTPLAPEVSLDMPLRQIPGDFTVEFAIAPGAAPATSPASVFDVRDLDSAPRPVARLNPIYPPRARMRALEGFVVLEFTVDRNGAVRDVQVVDSEPGDVFTRSAVQAVRNWRFNPGTRNGKAVEARVRQKVTFQLD